MVAKRSGRFEGRGSLVAGISAMVLWAIASSTACSSAPVEGAVACDETQTGCTCSPSDQFDGYACSPEKIEGGRCCSTSKWPDSGSCTCETKVGGCRDDAPGPSYLTCSCSASTTYGLSSCSPPTAAGVCCKTDERCDCYDKGHDCEGTVVASCEASDYQEGCADDELEVDACTDGKIPD